VVSCRSGASRTDNEYVLTPAITKRFPGALALDKVNSELRRAEVHCLVAQNSAGKSALVKILAGTQPMDSGETLLSNEPSRIHSPHHAQELGITITYQEFNPRPYLRVKR